MDEKALWNELARANYKYYIYADQGRGVTDADFIRSGETDYKRLITDDELITARYPDKRAVSILEIGCGVGRLLKPMSADFGSVAGIDISDEMITLAQERLKDCRNISLLITNGDSIPYPDNSIDLVFSYAVFQHIKTYEAADNYFKETYRVLKSGGMFKVLLGCVTYQNLKNWWSGICFTYEMIARVPEYGYKLLKQERTRDNRIWLWMEK